MPFPRANYFSHGLGLWRYLNFSPQIPTESTDSVDSAIVTGLQMMVKFRNVNNLTSFSHFDI